MITFEADVFSIDKNALLRLPEDASKLLPSRGQVAVTGSVEGTAFQTVLEPDRYWGHWMKVDSKLQELTGIKIGDRIKVEINPTKAWPEPTIPDDLQKALGSAPTKIQDLWRDITPMARWEWVRWVNATSVSETRARRVEVSISKMRSGKRRPCCFNLAACSDPELSKNGRLMA